MINFLKMNTLPLDLINHITNFLKASSLVLLNINNQAIDDEYLSIITYKPRHKLAIKKNNLSWINEILDHPAAANMESITNKHYRFYKDGKDGLNRKFTIQSSLWFYIEGLAVGQHKELFDVHAPLKYEFFIPSWRLFSPMVHIFDILMNFNDEDYIINKINLMFEDHEDLWFVCQILARNKKYCALQYFIVNHNIKVLDSRTCLSLMARRNWKFMFDVGIEVNPEMIYVSAILSDLELMDFILKQCPEQSQHRFYQILSIYLPTLHSDIYKHYKGKFSNDDFKPNHYYRNINQLLQPYYCSEVLEYITILDSPSWFIYIIEELIQHYINTNQLSIIRSILNILFEEKTEQSYQMFKEICTFFVCNLQLVHEYRMKFSKKNNYSFEEFINLDIGSLVEN